MEEQHELNDIILHKKSSPASSSRKVMVGIAIFTITLIVIVLIINRLNSTNPNIPHAQPEIVEEEVIVDTAPAAADEANARLDRIAEGIQKEPLQENDVIVIDDTTPAVEAEVDIVPVNVPKPAVKAEPVKVAEPASKPAPVVQKPVTKPAPTSTKNQQPAVAGKYYVQVGSFSKNIPSKSFLNKITKQGFNYTYHEVLRDGKPISKVLIGPFENETAARKAVPQIRKTIESGAFVTKI